MSHDEDRDDCGYDDDMPSGICSECGREVTCVEKDFGIGPYEFWGSKGEHHDYQCVTPCCDAEVVEGEEHLVSDTVHVAKRDHKVKDRYYRPIMAGSRYRKVVYISWIKGGRRFYNIVKYLLPPTGSCAACANARNYSGKSDNEWHRIPEWNCRLNADGKRPCAGFQERKYVGSLR